MNWKTDILLIGQDKIESHILQVSSIDKEYAGMTRLSLFRSTFLDGLCLYKLGVHI